MDVCKVAQCTKCGGVLKYWVSDWFFRADGDSVYFRVKEYCKRLTFRPAKDPKLRWRTRSTTITKTVDYALVTRAKSAYCKLCHRRVSLSKFEEVKV